MSWINRLLNLFRGRRLTREIDEELNFHLQSRTRDNIAAGMRPAEAMRDAAIRFGNRTLEQERVRDADLLVWLESVAQDVRFAGCTMRRHPAFTTMAVLILGLGIGASTGIFSLLMGTVFRSAPYERTGRLVYLAKHDKAGAEFDSALPYRDLMAVRDHSRSLERLATYRGGAWLLNTSAGPVRERGYYVSSDWLTVLNTQPALGRNFLPEEGQPGQGDVAILTDRVWRRVFDADPNIVGRHFDLEDRSITVVGVLSADFDFDGAEMLMPMVKDARTRAREFLCSAVANLRPGVSAAQAQSETDALIHGLETGDPADRRNWTMLLATPAMRHSDQCGPTCEQQHRGIWLLFGAVGLVMLMACANVANLLLARAMGRRREFEIRGAIGCSRTRLVRQILTESLVLFLFGGALGTGIAEWITVLLAKYAAAYVGAQWISLDGRVLAFTAAVTLATGVLFGLIPALRSAPAMSRIVDRNRTRIRGVLIGSEFALALIVLIGFGLLMHSFLSVASTPIGFRSANLLTTETTLRGERYRDPALRIALVRRLLEEVRAIPGVQSAAMTSDLPLSGAGATRIHIDGAAASDPRGEPVRYITASAGYFETLEIPTTDGRVLTDHDSEATEAVAVINQTMARMFFPNASAVGRRIQMEDERGKWRVIVGVAGDIRQRNLEEDSRPVLYRPYPQGMDSDLGLAVRAQSEAGMRTVMESLRRALRSADPRQPWSEWKSMRQVIYESESLTLRRPIVAMLGAFGWLGVILAAAGLYAVLSYSVTERTREIGIRLALGGQRSQLLGQILRDTLRMAAPGVIAGAAVAYELSSFLPSGHIGWSGSGVFLYGVNRMDAPTYIAVILLLGCVSILATLLPARRAMSVDPVAALRHE